MRTILSMFLTRPSAEVELTPTINLCFWQQSVSHFFGFCSPISNKMMTIKLTGSPYTDDILAKLIYVLGRFGYWDEQTPTKFYKEHLGFSMANNIDKDIKNACTRIKGMATKKSTLLYVCLCLRLCCSLIY